MNKNKQAKPKSFTDVCFVVHLCSLTFKSLRPPPTATKRLRISVPLNSEPFLFLLVIPVGAPNRGFLFGEEPKIPNVSTTQAPSYQKYFRLYI